MRDVREVEPGVWSVLDDTRSYEIRVAGNTVRVNGTEIEVSFQDPREWNRQSARSTATGLLHIRAPMPGKVIRLLAHAGDAVEAGQGLVIVEAMKMQNELKSPRVGRVVSVPAIVNDTVDAGTILVTIE